LSLPPLRERKEEVPILLKHFMSRMSELYGRPPLPLSPTLMEACLAHSWPGNLRELSNFVKRYLILADEKLAVSELHPKGETGSAGGGQGDEEGGLKSLGRNAKDEAEADAISQGPRSDQLEPQTGGGFVEDQLQGTAVKIRHYRLGETGGEKIVGPRLGQHHPNLHLII